MTKEEVVWLLVRIIGLCFLVNGFRYGFIVCENIMVMSASSPELYSKGSGLLNTFILEGLVCLIVGISLLKNGRILFRMLNSEPHKR